MSKSFDFVPIDHTLVLFVLKYQRYTVIICTKCTLLIMLLTHVQQHISYVEKQFDNIIMAYDLTIYFTRAFGIF